jgi:hypothetical protein
MNQQGTLHRQDGGDLIDDLTASMGAAGMQITRP